jgi:hypothetical protein
MNIIIFCLTILGMYGIITYAWKAWNNSDIKDRMSDIENQEMQYQRVKVFKKDHRGLTPKQEKELNEFRKQD